MDVAEKPSKSTVEKVEALAKEGGFLVSYEPSSYVNGKPVTKFTLAYHDEDYYKGLLGSKDE